MPVIRRDMQELAGRFTHTSDDVGMGVTGRADPDARGKVQKAIAINIPDLGTASVRHDERIVTTIRG